MKYFRFVSIIFLFILYLLVSCTHSAPDQKKVEQLVKEHILKHLDSTLYTPIKFSEVSKINISQLSKIRLAQLVNDSVHSPETHSAERMQELRTSINQEMKAFEKSFFIQHAYLQRMTATTPTGELYFSDSLVADRLYLINASATVILNDFYPEQYGFNKLSP